MFFSHRTLYTDGQASVPKLAEKLTLELVDHIEVAPPRGCINTVTSLFDSRLDTDGSAPRPLPSHPEIPASARAASGWETGADARRAGEVWQRATDWWGGETRLPHGCRWPDVSSGEFSVHLALTVGNFFPQRVTTFSQDAISLAVGEELRCGEKLNIFTTLRREFWKWLEVLDGSGQKCTYIPLPFGPTPSGSRAPKTQHSFASCSQQQAWKGSGGVRGKIPWKRTTGLHQLQDLWVDGQGADQAAGGTSSQETQGCRRYLLSLWWTEFDLTDSHVSRGTLTSNQDTCWKIHWVAASQSPDRRCC